ncbi:hypothetical protein [uncultured Cytophaga sp.]|uniref:DUF6891 domain-containing protein n=1 Tax=uncultured Cytophaga sp. TaxID=160238 RepID=UPI00261ECA06|nr:hypothetical protein [uncultured Cytophaga sp.]
MTEDQEFIYQSIVSQMRLGFLSNEEITDNIIEEVEDNEFEDEISKKWIKATIKSEFEKLKMESKSWENPTKTEKLIAAFEELRTLNIIALHNAGYTMSDGESDVVEVEIALRENGIESDGYCFYHQQDLERAMDYKAPSLMIAFQKVNNTDDAVTIRVGKLVVAILKSHDLNVVWDESVNKKIELPGFAWQKIYDEDDDDLLDSSRVVGVMIKK